MAKQTAAERGRESPTSAVATAFRGAIDEGGRIVRRDLTKVNPLTTQFEPTPAEPVRRRYKMAGGC